MRACVHVRVCVSLFLSFPPTFHYRKFLFSENLYARACMYIYTRPHTLHVQNAGVHTYSSIVRSFVPIVSVFSNFLIHLTFRPSAIAPTRPSARPPVARVCARVCIRARARVCTCHTLKASSSNLFHLPQRRSIRPQFRARRATPVIRSPYTDSDV